MELDLSPVTLLVTGAFWIFVIFLVWFIPVGFTAMRDKILLTICSLPLIYLMVSIQMNR